MKLIFVSMKRSILLGNLAFGIALMGVPNPSPAQTLSIQANLRAEPTTDGKVLKQLPADTAVKVLKRQGFYLEIEAAGLKGWVKASEVSLSKPGSSGLSNLDTGRMGKGNIVSTSAARGLSSKELIAAKPDFSQVEQLKSLGVAGKVAEDFALQGGLQQRKLALLSAPQSSKVSTDGKQGQGAKSTTRKGSNKPSNKAAKSDDDEDDDE